MSNLIPMSGYPVPVRPYSQITPFTYRDNSTYLEILEQIRTWIQNTLVPHLDTEYEELVQSWADNIQLLTTNYETLLADQATTLRGEFVAADDALDSRIDSLTSTVASNDASVRAAFAAADAALQSQITTINSNVAAMNTSIRADFAAADATLQTNINTVNTNTNARIDGIINNNVSTQDSVVAGLVNSNTSLTNTALDAKYATDADMNAANAHLTSVDGSITSLSGRMTTAEGTIASHTSSIATNESAISTTNTNLGTTNSNVTALTTRVTNAEGNITTNTSDLTAFKAAAPRTVASASARDALFPSPVPGNSVWRSDTLQTETYYAATGSPARPAGWYSGQEGGLVPIVPTSVNLLESGTATVSQNGVTAFTGTKGVRLNGVFSSKFRNYKIVVRFSTLTNDSSTCLRLSANGSDYSGGTYYVSGQATRANGSSFTYASAGQGNATLGDLSATFGAMGSIEITLFSPNEAGKTSGYSQSLGGSSTIYAGFSLAHAIDNAFQADGLLIFPNVGYVAGTIQVYGYRD